AILVPQAAVDRTPRGLAQVWVVGKDGKAYRRELKTARAVGDRWLVDAGLAAGDQVIVEGAQGLAEGMPVKVAPAASVAGGG
ncbi:MAG: HlyD family secretion protein, partial [Gammaproteobacteria bacterium]